MGFEDERGGRRRELICECREVRCDRDNRHHGHHHHGHHCGGHREDEFRCRCRESNRRRRNFWW